MSKLDEARIEINLIDEKMITLFKERMALAKEIALYKKANNLAVYDKKREEALIYKNLNILNDKSLESYYLTFLKGLLTASKDYQKDLIK